MKRQNIEPFFLDGPRGRLFCILHRPVGAPLGGFLYLHPFAEEMHKSRRMAALQSRRLAELGYVVLQVDLTGCGDSWGDFGDSTWDIWKADGLAAWNYLRQHAPLPLKIWGLRIGATLAADLSCELPDVSELLLWQPVLSGETFLTQFLRIRLAGDMLTDAGNQTGTKELRARLQHGIALEVGGNMIGPMMAGSLDTLRLVDMKPPCPVMWIEVGSEATNQPSPSSKRIIDAWGAEGVTVKYGMVEGVAFWNAQEIVECASLLDFTEKGVLG